MNKRTIIFETELTVGDTRAKKELADHLEEIKKLVEPLKINTVRIKTEVEIK